ncbi:hypothetical protein ONO23_06552 [Micromonospora noduli]|nr:hypothetical protein ONO23_06552 [Micromonospora noduli]
MRSGAITTTKSVPVAFRVDSAYGWRTPAGSAVVRAARTSGEPATVCATASTSSCAAWRESLRANQTAPAAPASTSSVTTIAWRAKSCPAMLHWRRATSTTSLVAPPFLPSR